MNFRDPILEKAKKLLLVIARNDEALLARVIQQEIEEHGEVTLNRLVERIEAELRQAAAVRNGAMASALREKNHLVR